MNKSDLIEKMSSEAGITKAQATAALNSFIGATSSALKSGDNLILVGFGTFSVSQRSARTGRNPRSGEVINIPAKKVVRFKAGTELSKNVG
jgi:DNA-binding protein HU-beta